MRNIQRVLVALCLMVPVLAYADTAVNEMNAAITQLAKAPETLLSNAPFADTGKMLMMYILAILFSWKAVKIMMDGAPIQQVIGELVNLILLFGIAKFFMDTTVQNQFATGFDTLATKAATAAGSSADASSLATMITSALQQMMEAAFHLLFGGAGDKQESWSIADLNPVKWFMWCVTLIIRLGTALIILICALLYCGMLFISYTMVSIGLVFAPLMVPWLLWDASAFLFHGWLKFMIVAGVQKIVAAVVYGMTIGYVTNVDKMAENSTSEWDASFYYYATCFLITAIISYLIMQVPSIANGLVSGAPKTGFSPPQGMTPGGALGRAGGMKASTGGKAALGGIKGGAQGMKGGWSAGGSAAGKAVGAIAGGVKGAASGVKAALSTAKGAGRANAAPGATSGAGSTPSAPPPALPRSTAGATGTSASDYM